MAAWAASSVAPSPLPDAGGRGAAVRPDLAGARPPARAFVGRAGPAAALVGVVAFVVVLVAGLVAVFLGAVASAFVGFVAFVAVVVVSLGDFVVVAFAAFVIGSFLVVGAAVGAAFVFAFAAPPAFACGAWRAAFGADVSAVPVFARAAFGIAEVAAAVFGAFGAAALAGAAAARLDGISSVVLVRLRVVVPVATLSSSSRRPPRPVLSSHAPAVRARG
jgi:hypothetical protein